MAEPEAEGKDKKKPGLFHASHGSNGVHEPSQLLARLMDKTFRFMFMVLAALTVGTLSLGIKIALLIFAITLVLLTFFAVLYFIRDRRSNILSGRDYVAIHEASSNPAERLLLIASAESVEALRQSDDQLRLLSRDTPALDSKNLHLSTQANSTSSDQFGGSADSLDWTSLRVSLNQRVDNASEVLKMLGEAEVPVAALFGSEVPETMVVSYGREVPVSHVKALMNLLVKPGKSFIHTIDTTNSTFANQIYIGSYAYAER